MVLLADVFSKVYHKHLRALLTPHIEAYMLSTMCGGFQRRGTDFASLYLSAFYGYAWVNGKNYAVLFLDVSAAFESLQRVFAFEGVVTDSQAQSIFMQCNMPASVWPDFVDALREPEAFRASGVPSILSKIVGVAHGSTWYSIEGLSEFVLAEKGSKPADPLGDIIFAFLIAKVLSFAKHKFVQNVFVCTTIKTEPTSSIFGEFGEQSIDLFCANYVDDNEFPLLGESAGEVVSLVAALAGSILGSFAAHLM